MIKRLIGLIATVAVLFVLVMTILHAGSYRSMIWDRSDRPAAASERISDEVRQAASAAPDAVAAEPETGETGV